jgi:transposase
MSTPEAPSLTALRAALEVEVAASAERNRRLDHLARELRQALCGWKSEKLTADERQLAFEDRETARRRGRGDPDPRAIPRRAATPASARRAVGRPPADLPRIERVAEPGGTLRPCGCAEMARIGEDRTERLDPGRRPFLPSMRPQGASIPAGPVFAPPDCA